VQSLKFLTLSKNQAGMAIVYTICEMSNAIKSFDWGDKGQQRIYFSADPSKKTYVTVFYNIGFISIKRPSGTGPVKLKNWYTGSGKTDKAKTDKANWKLDIPVTGAW
jgi:hypothetical protein